MSSTVNKISNLIESQMPDFVRNENPLFVSFLESYYEFLEQSNNSVTLGNLLDRVELLKDLGDVDLTIDLFADHLYNQYLSMFPTDIPANKATIVKNIKNFYRSKGSKKSYRFLFHALYGQDIDIVYPKDNLLIASSGKWFVEKSIRITNITLNGVADQTLDGLNYFVNTKVVGNTSETTAVVERASISFENGLQIFELFLSSQIGSFSNGETISATDVNGNILVATIFSGILTSVNLISGGSRYNIGDQAVVQSNSGNGGIVYVSGTTTGNTTGIVVLNGGAGFLVNDPMLITGGGGTGANAAVATLSGTANSFYHANTIILLTDIISNYQNVALNSANYGFPGMANSNLNSGISSAMTNYSLGPIGPIGLVAMTANGAGYVTAPSVDVTGNTIIKTLGVLGRLQVNNPGLNYANGDQLLFTNSPGGFGTGASGQVVSTTANGSIEHVAFVAVHGFPSGGTGFSPTALPTVSVNTANGTGANIVVTTLLGYGDPFTSFVANTATIGTITSLTIGNPGRGFVLPPTINLTSLGDGTAQANAQIVSGTFTYPGRFLDETGFPSGYNFLQDQDYYQNFSYVIRVKQSITQYQKYVKNLLHPGGMKMWGQYQLISNVANSAANTTNSSLVYPNLIDVNYLSTANGYFTRTNGIQNTTNSQTGQVSLWFQPTQWDANTAFSNTLIFLGNTNTTPTFSVSLVGDGVSNVSSVYLKILGKDSGGNTILDLRSNTRDVIIPNTWVSLIASWNLGNSAQTSMYLTNVSSMNVVTFSNSTIVYNVGNVGIGSSPGGTTRFLGNLSQVLFDTCFVDFNTYLYRRNFYVSSNLYPINVQSYGSITTGLKPLIFVSGNPTPTANNYGIGGELTVIGALTGNTMYGELENPFVFNRITEALNYRVTEDGRLRVTEFFDP